MVVGETARSHNFSLNGYSRPTNRYTEKFNVISFKKVYSCGTSTAVSIPCMFSNLNRRNYDNNTAQSQDNLLNILDHAGLSINWIDNQSNCKHVCDRIPHENVDFSYDAELLKKIDLQINTITKDKILVLHLMGSHGPNYYERYPENYRNFKPECRQKDVQNCTRKEVINSYNNTILYTDHLLASLINKLITQEKNYNTGLIYISDHGESLGEKGLYLHGMPYIMAPEYQKIVPMIMWLSPGLTQEKKINSPCLYNKATNGVFSHDNLFHSVLGVLNIETNEYNAKLDIFHNCRAT